LKHSSASSVSQYVALSGYLGLHTSMLSLLTSALSDLKSMNLRQLLLQLVSLGLIVTSALVIWKSLMLVTGSDSPVVVVLSGSMEPAFYRGDILFLYLAERATRVGEIVVFNIKGREIPIVHRVIRAHGDLKYGGQELLTKGDNNYSDDTVLYAAGQDWLLESQIMGRAVGFLPHVGRVTIIMNDYPVVKYVVIGVLGLLVVTSRE
jgi:signal peptidase I